MKMKKLSLSTYHEKREARGGIRKMIFAARHPLLEIAHRVAHHELEQHKAHRKRADDARQAESAARKKAEDDLTGRTAFVAGLVHDLKTPLMIINGATEALKLKAGEDGMLTSMVGLIQGSEARLLSTINWALDFAQADAGRLRPKPKTLDLGVEIATVADFMRPLAAQKGLAFNVENGHPVHASLDPRLLHHILLNLLSNAVKYTDKGSVTMSVKKESGYATIRICDTGIGIKNADLESIFQEYRRGEGVERMDGRGIGLSVVKKFTELMGGAVKAYSEVGKGSTFKLSFRAAEREAVGGPANHL